MQAKLILSIVVASFLAALQLAQAQQPTKVPRIGYISGTGDATNQGPFVEALRQGLLKLGYVEGKNFVIEYRGAEGQMRPRPGHRERTRATQGGYPYLAASNGNPHRQASNQDDPHCHGG